MASFHISRWRYWYAYLVITVLIILTIWFRDRAADSAAWVVGIIAVVMLVVFEVLIRMERLVVTQTGIEHRTGLFAKNVTHLLFRSIANVSCNQTFFQRIFRYGDVLIDTPGQSHVEIVITKFANASKLEKLISEHIHKAHMGHGHSK